MTSSFSQTPFGSILCPVDFSTHAKRALEYAARVAHRSGGSLNVLFVNDPLLVSAAAAAYDERALASRSRAELDRFVRQTLKSRAPAGNRIRTFVTMGDPAREILSAARKLDARLIVLGSEGLSGASKLFFGSTTARVLAGAVVPILAVPPHGSGPGRSGWPGRRVLAAVTLGRHATRDVAAAAGLTRWLGATLALTHVVEPARLPAWLSPGAGRHEKSRVASARRQLAQLANGAGSAGFADAHVLVGEPASRISALASELGAGLVVVTLRKGPGILGSRQGRITYQVVRQAGVPVLALPSAWSPDRRRA